MKYFYLDKIESNSLMMKDFKESLSVYYKNGDLFIIPTDTVYGISGDPNNVFVSEKILKIKKRSTDKSFILLSFDLNFFFQVFDFSFPPWIIKEFPIAITCIAKVKKDLLSLADNKGNLAMRYVDFLYLKNLDFYPPLIISTSVNYEGELPLTSEEEIMEFAHSHKEIKLVLIDNKRRNITLLQNMSTIIDFSSYPYKILRMGSDLRVQKILNEFRDNFIINCKT